jgi:hypothetical protein
LTFARRKKWNAIRKRREISHQHILSERARKGEKKEGKKEK